MKRIAVALLEVLLYLSKLQPPVIHRDIKPENVIIDQGTPGGQVYLVDFGGVQVTPTLMHSLNEQGVDMGATLGSTIVGTYGYMAPEQFRGMAEPKSDLYGLGATLLYLISGPSLRTSVTEKNLRETSDLLPSRATQN